MERSLSNIYLMEHGTDFSWHADKTDTIYMTDANGAKYIRGQGRVCQ